MVYFCFVSFPKWNWTKNVTKFWNKQIFIKMSTLFWKCCLFFIYLFQFLKINGVSFLHFYFQKRFSFCHYSDFFCIEIHLFFCNHIIWNMHQYHALSPFFCFDVVSQFSVQIFSTWSHCDCSTQKKNPHTNEINSNCCCCCLCKTFINIKIRSIKLFIRAKLCSGTYFCVFIFLFFGFVVRLVWNFLSIPQCGTHFYTNIHSRQCAKIWFDFKAYNRNRLNIYIVLTHIRHLHQFLNQNKLFLMFFFLNWQFLNTLYFLEEIYQFFTD